MTDFKDFTGIQIAVGSIVSASYPLNGLSKKFSYSSSALSENKILTMYYQNIVNYNYDTLGRMSSKTTHTRLFSYAMDYTYIPGSDANSTTSKVASIKNNNGVPITYEYDANGNITKITQGIMNIVYYYNELNELIQEDNQVLNKTIIYSYDVGGNLMSKLEIPYGGGSNTTITYSYDDVWKDKLVSYNGKPIEHDAIGNLTKYDGYTYTWEEGRQLKTIVGNGKNISCKYNDAGIRTERNVDGVITKYYLSGNEVVYETNGTDIIYYTYDSTGHLVSMNLNGVEYYYIRNAQGDIIGLFDKNGVQVVSYVYDSWGKVVSTTGTLASTVGVKNQYRYRGYRFDSETGLYYLNSRYYSPEWCRYLNADSTGGEVGTLLSPNMFMYCFNRPINLDDPNGNWPTLGQIFKAAAIVAVTAVVITAVLIAAPAVAGAVSIAAGMTFGAGTMAIASAITSIATIGVAVGIGAFGVNRAAESITGKNYIAKTIFRGNTKAYDATEVAFNMAGTGMLGIAADNKYTRFQAAPIFKGRGGYGFPIGKNIEVLYTNPRSSGGPGGTFIAYKNKSKWRLDWDPAHDLHAHWGKGKAAQNIHRSIRPTTWGQDLGD